MNKHPRHLVFVRGQRGVSTLFVALSLLGILTVITLFAVAYGVYEQRVSGNEYRYKLAFQSAEAGLNQAVEYAKLNTGRMISTETGGWMVAGSSRWQACTSALPVGMVIDPCLSEPDAARRAQMHRYVGATSGVLPLSEALPGASSQTFTTVGGLSAFAAVYEVYATLCRTDPTLPGQCVLNPIDSTEFAVTLVSRGRLTGEGGSATVKRTFHTFRTIGGEPAAPLIAAGTALGLGNAQLVPNPNGGGVGVPLSVWSSGNADVSGASFASCHLGEWLNRYTGAAPTAQNVLDGVCATCTCNGLQRGYGLISSGGAVKMEGGDILDVESGASPDVNVDGNLDHRYFPPDLFAYVFGVPSSEAVNYLTSNAVQITSCSTLDTSSGGLYWYTPTSDCTLQSQVGSLQNPVVLVSNGKLEMNSNATIFGLLYVRSTAGAGNVLKATGNPQVYGSVILEGNANISGGPQIIFNRKVFQNILNSQMFVRLGPVAGSWSDDLR